MSEIVASNLVVERTGARLLDGVSLALRPGELVGIIGPNGAGKSTLMRCLAGLLVPDGGSVRLGGRDAASLTGRERARLLGYVPQTFVPAWDFSVRDILEIGAARASGGRAAIERIAVALELCSLLDRRWSRLSGGERARALFASVIVGKPPILLADEPGASLDLGHRIALLARLRDYSRNRAVAIVLHDLDLALRYCDRLVLVEAGRIVLDGDRVAVGTDARLDAVFGVAFRRIEIDAGSDTLLPIPRAAPRPSA